MPVKNPQELFLLMLSDLRQGTERTTRLFQELGDTAQHPDIKEALEARVFLSRKILDTLDQCFNLIGAQPVKVSGKMYDMLAEDFRNELGEIQNPVARNLFVLSKAAHLVHLRIAQYQTLIAAADISGHYGVGVLLETCLADKLVFAERTGRMIRRVVENKVSEKIAARSAA